MFVRHSGRSFIYSKNNKGHKIEPCGTPHLIGCLDETKLPVDTFVVGLRDMTLTIEDLGPLFHNVAAFLTEYHD